MSKDVTELTAALMELGWMDFTGIGFPLNSLNCFIAKGDICLEGPKSSSKKDSISTVTLQNLVFKLH